MLSRIAMILSSAGGEGVIETATLLTELNSSCPANDNFHVTYDASGLAAGDLIRIYAIQGASEQQVYEGPALTSETVSLIWGARTVAVGSGVQVEISARVELIRSGEVRSSQTTNIEGPYEIESPATCVGDFN